MCKHGFKKWACSFLRPSYFCNYPTAILGKVSFVHLSCVTLGRCMELVREFIFNFLLLA